MTIVLIIVYELWFSVIFRSYESCYPSGICLPVTELLQSPFRTEFSMGSRSRWYRRSLRRHRRFLQSYHWSLLRCHDPWGDRWPPIVARLAKHKTLLNIVKHHETHVKHCEPLVKHDETLLKQCETSWNTQTLVIRCDDIGARCGDVGDRAELLAISVLSFWWYRQSV